MSAKIKSIPTADWLAFGVVMLVTLAFRFYQLGDLPAGLPKDVAVNGLDGWRLFNRGGHTLFLNGNGGRESLFIYLQGLSIMLFGSTAFAVRLPGAIADTAMVGILYWFARWWFRYLPTSEGNQTADYPVFCWGALFVGLLAASSYWLVSISRLGFRAILVPVFAVPLIWTFLLGWRTGRYRWFVLAGLFLGLQGYTYPAGRMLLLIVLAAILPDLVFRFRAMKRVRWVGLGITFIAAGLIYLPIFLTTQLQPAPAASRVASVAIWSFTESSADLVTAILENILLTTRFFCCQGKSDLVLFGLPGRPALNMGLSLALVLGIGLAVRQTKRLEMRLLLIWFFASWLPTLVTIEAPHPLRLIGAAPPMFLLAAMGLYWLSRQQRWLTVGLTLWLCLATGMTFRDYFWRWPQSEAYTAIFNADVVDLYQTIQARAGVGETIYLSRTDYNQPVMHYYLMTQFPPVPIATFAEPVGQATFLGDSGTMAWIRLSAGQAHILPAFTSDTANGLGEWQGAATIDSSILNWVKPSQKMDVSFGAARLQGMAYHWILEPGQALDVTLFWQANEPITEDYDLLVHLVDDGQRGWAEDVLKKQSSDLYPTSYWRPNLDLVPDYHQLILPPDMPLGRYRLAVSVYDPTQGHRLSLSQPQLHSPDTVFVGPLKVPLNQSNIEPETQTEVNFSDPIVLEGYRVSESHLQAGEPLTVDLYWRSNIPTAIDYTVFVHLLDQAGNRVTGHDSPPVDGNYPTAIWHLGEQIVDRHSLDSQTLVPGTYRLAVGLYDPLTGMRLPVNDDPTGQYLLPNEIEIVTE